MCSITVESTVLQIKYSAFYCPKLFWFWAGLLRQEFSRCAVASLVWADFILEWLRELMENSMTRSRLHVLHNLIIYVAFHRQNT